MLWLGKPEPYTSWEAASSLPPSVIEELEKGLSLESTEKKTSQHGHEVGTFVIDKVSETQPSPKRARTDRPVIVQNTTG